MINDLPLVSIGLASYNNSKYILNTLNGIKNQTYKNIELIINDDCSTDDSREIISKWLTDNPQIPHKYLHADTNNGICKSLNSIVENCKGDYICLIGSDDVYLPRFIENRVSYLEGFGGKYAFCYSNTYLIDTEGKRIGEDIRVVPRNNVFQFLAKNSKSLCKPFTCLIRRSTFEIIGKFDETLMYEDLDWILRVTANLDVVFFDALDSEYRVVPGSLSTFLTSSEGLISQRTIFKKNLGVQKTCDKYFRMKMRRLAVIAYKNRLGISKNIAVTNFKEFFTILDFFLIVLTYIPLDILLIGKSWFRRMSKFLFH
jgi:glycosyltransferase involved in cell wall biosynthesis